MTSSQKSIPSGLGSKTTAAEVLKNVNLKGKNVVVTGGNSGIGLETVRALANAGAKVITTGRDQQKTKDALKGLENVSALALDLVDPTSVNTFADEVLTRMDHIDILINNAGTQASKILTRDSRGYESSFAANHLGHFQLTKRLLAALKKNAGARVVALSSMAHQIAPFDFDDWNFEKKKYDMQLAYGQSKLANALFAVGLDVRERGSGLRAFAVHPGAILSGLVRFTPDEDLKAWGVQRENGVLKGPESIFKTPEQGAATSVWCAASPQLNGIGGLYCADCDISQIGDDESKNHNDVRAWATDEEAARRLWALSEMLLESSMPK
jgi:NAD(P)-dependent dehydrogenase (short-subunit alcohol dehydrogenase family)